MPIKQERMIALIRAGEDFQQALRKLRAMIVSASTSAAGGGLPPATALQNLEIMSQEAMLMDNPVESVLTLREESQHFAKRAARNSRDAAKQRRKRAGAQHMGVTLSEADDDEYLRELLRR